MFLHPITHVLLGAGKLLLRPTGPFIWSTPSLTILECARSTLSRPMRRSCLPVASLKIGYGINTKGIFRRPTVSKEIQASITSIFILMNKNNFLNTIFTIFIYLPCADLAYGRLLITWLAAFVDWKNKQMCIQKNKPRAIYFLAVRTCLILLFIVYYCICLDNVNQYFPRDRRVISL